MKRLCLEPGCPNPATYRGRCQEHAAKQERTRTKAGRSIYNTKRWKMTRRRQLFEHPLCQCSDPDCNEIATDVDHITDIEDGGDPWSFSNLQSLAHDCHSRKTRRHQLEGAA